MTPKERDKESSASSSAVDQEQAEAESPDHSVGSAEDERDDAPSGKEALTETDKELPEDQTTFQTDSDAS